MAEAFNFTREVIKELILLYEQYPELYNANLPQYKNRNIGQDRLGKIAEELNKKYPGVNAQQIQSKLKNLRTQYFHELNKYKKSMLSGSGRDDIYKPSWWCFDYLMFLSVGSPIEQGESNLSLKDIQTPDVEEHVSEAGSQLLFDGTIDELSQSEIIIESSEPKCKKQRTVSPKPGTSTESPKPGTSRETSTDRDTLFSPLSPTMSTTSKGKRKTNKNKASEDISGALLKEASEAVRSLKNEEVDHFESFALNLAAEMRRIKNPRAVNALKRKFLNEVFDVFDEEQDY